MNIGTHLFDIVGCYCAKLDIQYFSTHDFKSVTLYEWYHELTGRLSTNAIFLQQKDETLRSHLRSTVRPFDRSSMDAGDTA
jgi:hypothetical protein